MKKLLTASNLINIFFYSSAVVFALAIFVKICFTHDLSVKNDELNDVIAQKIELEKQIEDLKFQSYELSSLQRIEKIAIAKGFIKLDDRILLVDLSKDHQVASLPR